MGVYYGIINFTTRTIASGPWKNEVPNMMAIVESKCSNAQYFHYTDDIYMAGDGDILKYDHSQRDFVLVTDKTIENYVKYMVKNENGLGKFTQVGFTLSSDYDWRLVDDEFDLVFWCC